MAKTLKEESAGNLTVHDTHVTVSVNPKVYPLDAVYSAAYVFIDRAYVVLDGDPDKEVLVKLKPKKQGDLEALGNEFNNELLNYAVYATQAERNRAIKEAMVYRALVTNKGASYTDDPLGIAQPWEESDEKG